MYPYVNIFNYKIGINWVMIIISLIIMSIINIFRCKKYNLKKFNGIIISVLVNIFAILGAVILYNIENYTKRGFSFGLSFFGTIFFLPLFMYLVSFLYKTDKKEFSDFWALTIPLELSFVRLGCYLSGCCLGIYSEFGVQFPNDPIGYTRIPIQLYEVVFDIIIFIVLVIYDKKSKTKGLLYPIFILLYSFIRFILEFFRDTNKYILGLSNGQLFATICFFIGIIIFYKNITNTKRYNV